MFQSPLIYFTDPVLRAPTIGCMLMCLSASLVGVVVLLRRQSLVGEALAHAAYPGVMLGVLIAAALDETSEGFPLAFCVLAAAAFTAYIGLWFTTLLQNRYSIRADSALCFVLASFFGVGVTLASQLQFTATTLYRQGTKLPLRSSSHDDRLAHLPIWLPCPRYLVVDHYPLQGTANHYL